ncbi:MAG: hypothetical protein NT027_06325 [Proteobacteria bacterium]|nr:hypothetical protein [Pseudomonadota bacterium]
MNSHTTEMRPFESIHFFHFAYKKFNALRVFKFYKAKNMFVMGTECSANLAFQWICEWAKVACQGSCIALINYLFVATMFAASSSLFGETIEIPPPPSVIPPILTPDLQSFERSEKSKTQRNKDEIDRFESQQKSRVEKRKEKELQNLKTLANTQNLHSFFEISLILPTVSARNDRKNYTADVSSHINFFIRPKIAKPSDEVQLWTALRVSPFSGSGQQNGISGRYSYLHFGPSIGIGKINARKVTPKVPNNSEGTRINAIDDLPDEDEQGSGWIGILGIGATSKFSDNNTSMTEEASDFTSQTWYFDEPGLHFEIRHLTLFHGLMSRNFILGTQLGKNKITTYIGIGLGGWL